MVSNNGMPTKGFKRLVYWVMQNEETESYGAFKESPANVKIDVQVTNSEGSFSANDKVMVKDNEFAYATVNLELGNETEQMEADLHGHTIDSNGNLICNVNDKAPYVALAYEVPLAGGVSAYRLLPKVKFGIGGESASTKEENSITYGTKTISGQAIANKNGYWCAKGKTGDSNISQWFVTPQVPGASTNIDKGILDLIIGKAKAIDTSLYTDATVQTLETKLTAAETEYADATSTQSEVDTAAQELLDAIVGLVTK